MNLVFTEFYLHSHEKINKLFSFFRLIKNAQCVPTEANGEKMKKKITQCTGEKILNRGQHMDWLGGDVDQSIGGKNGGIGSFEILQRKSCYKHTV